MHRSASVHKLDVSITLAFFAINNSISNSSISPPPCFVLPDFVAILHATRKFNLSNCNLLGIKYISLVRNRLMLY